MIKSRGRLYKVTEITNEAWDDFSALLGSEWNRYEAMCKLGLFYRVGEGVHSL